MATPEHKVYDGHGQYIAACRYAEDAAAILAIHPGGTLRLDHRVILWREGGESLSAGESYDVVARTVHARRRAVSVVAHRALTENRRLRRGELQRAADAVSTVV